MNYLLKEHILEHEYFIDNEYLDKYIELINSNITNKREKFRTERHHIIPRAWFVMHNAKVDSTQTNIVNLLYKDHIIAHYLLYKCTSGNLSKSNLKAFMQMTFYKIKINDAEKRAVLDSIGDELQTVYEDYQRVNSEQNKGKKLSEETKKKISAGGKGRVVSEATRAKMRKSKSELHKQHIREAQKGIKRTQEQINKIKLSKQGVHWFTNGIINIQSKDCPEGFHLGRTIVISEEQKQRIREGRKRCGPWNKGLTKEDNPSLARPNNGKYQRGKKQ